MPAPSAFISFEMEDNWARDSLKQQIKARCDGIGLVDYLSLDSFDTTWRTQCRHRIKRTKGTIVLIGKTTHKSSAVLWEIAETVQQNHRIIGIQIDRDESSSIPAGIPLEEVIDWNIESVLQKLRGWT